MGLSSSNSSQWRRGGVPVGAWFVAAVFGALAGLLFSNIWPYRPAYTVADAVPDWAHEVSTVRTPKLRPEISHAGYVYRCSECHRLFPSPQETTRLLTQHSDILLEHGINERCFNCHHRTLRDAFVTDAGEPIPYDQPQLLCARCHGPVYRDWTHGVHGRTNGFWDATRGPVERKKCIQCHDPHAPAFGSMPPAPGPHTLRMGDPHRDQSHDDAVVNPLRVYDRSSQSGAVH